MKSWLGLIAAPSIALTNLSLAYALVIPSCTMHNSSLMQGTNGLCLLATIVITLLCWREWQQLARVPSSNDAAASLDSIAADLGTRRKFLAGVATLNSALFVLVIFGQWIAQWILSPCQS